MVKLGRLIIFDTQDPVFHLSSLEAVWRELDGNKTGPVLFVRSHKPCVLLGASQSAKQAADVNYCSDHQIPIIRRPSEGGTIYADEYCLLYSLVMCDIKTEGMFERLRDAIIDILAGLGLSARAKPPNDILVNGRKAAGLTATQWYSVWSFSGTLLLDTDPIRLDAIIGPGTAAKLVGINQSVPAKLAMDELASRVIDRIESLVDSPFQTTGLTEKEKSLASELITDKYGNEKWNRIKG